MVFLLLVSIVYFIWADEFMGFFTQEPAVIETGVLCLRIMCIGYVFFAYGMVISQAFNGAGDTRTPTMMNFICFWLIEIPLAYLLASAVALGPRRGLLGHRRQRNHVGSDLYHPFPKGEMEVGEGMRIFPIFISSKKSTWTSAISTPFSSTSAAYLIDWNPRYVFRQIFDTEEEMEFFLGKYLYTGMDMNNRMPGRSLQEATTSLLLQHPEYADPIPGLLRPLGRNAGRSDPRNRGIAERIVRGKKLSTLCP